VASEASEFDFWRIFAQSRKLRDCARKSVAPVTLLGAPPCHIRAAVMPETGEQIATAFATKLAGLNSTSQVRLPDERHVAMPEATHPRVRENPTRRDSDR
jgi:hypothetical protein